jgi:hypothetical protein
LESEGEEDLLELRASGVPVRPVAKRLGKPKPQSLAARVLKAKQAEAKIDFVLQAQNAQRSFRAISLRNVGTSGE